MTQPYNTTFMDNSTGMTDLIIGINNNVDGFLIPGLLFIIWGVLFIAGRKNEEAVTAFTGSSFIVLLISIFLFAAGIVGYYIIALPLVGFVGGMLAYFLTNRS